ncbi:MAG: tyrosine-type recombinase/integrase [Leuconostoc suionicum]|uniref:tyrosine-type recombinase/integrase n=1 Tax=Leuconostoc suionicum TaxID=1511761 RepID=UPI003F343269
MASFEKRGKKWRAVVSYTDAHGVRQKTSKTFDLKKTATVWAAETETKVNGGLDVNAGNISFADYYKRWFETYKHETVRQSTFLRYLSFHNIVIQLFGDVKLNKLTSQYIQQIINEFGQTHNKSYVRVFLASIKSSLRDAMLDGLIERDIFSRLQPVGQEAKKFDNYLSATEFEKLQSWLYSNRELMLDDDFLLAVLIALETGARLGEVSALQSSDIDRDRLLININKSYSAKSYKVTKPKNIYSIREVSVTKSLINLIQWYIDTTGVTDIFPKHFVPDTVSRKIKRLTNELNINNIKFHGLRHSHVSYLLHNNIDITYISKRVGHANINVTLSTYSHLLKEKENAQEKLTVSILENNL